MKTRHERHIGFTEGIEPCEVERLDKEIDEHIEKILDSIRVCMDESGMHYCRIEPEHHVEDLIAQELSEEFSNSIVIVESRRGCFIKKGGLDAVFVRSSIENVIRRLKRRLDISDECCGLLDFNPRLIADVFG